jgi:TM2 domain
MTPHYKSKTLAAWLAFLAGGFGAHRFYLYGLRDRLAWLHGLPTALGLWGLWRARELGQDDMLSWLLLPLLGAALSAAMLAGIVYGLMPDERWNARYNTACPTQHRSGWGVIFAVVSCLMVGAGVLMSTLAYSGQRYFEYQIEAARAISQQGDR